MTYQSQSTNATTKKAPAPSTNQSQSKLAVSIVFAWDVAGATCDGVIVPTPDVLTDVGDPDKLEPPETKSEYITSRVQYL